jgi:paraquat-inducible protein B
MLEGDAQQRQTIMRRFVEQRGLRAQLRSGNLITGQLFVAFDFFPNAPKAKIDWSRDPVELPVVPSTVSDIEANSPIVAKRQIAAWLSVTQEKPSPLDQTLKDAPGA